MMSTNFELDGVFCNHLQDLKKYFDSSGGSIGPKTVQVLSHEEKRHVNEATTDQVDIFPPAVILLPATEGVDFLPRPKYLPQGLKATKHPD